MFRGITPPPVVASSVKLPRPAGESSAVTGDGPSQAAPFSMRWVVVLEAVAAHGRVEETEFERGCDWFQGRIEVGRSDREAAIRTTSSLGPRGHGAELREEKGGGAERPIHGALAAAFISCVMHALRTLVTALVAPLDPVLHAEAVVALRRVRHPADLDRLAGSWLTSGRGKRLKLVKHGSGTFMVVEYDDGWTRRLAMAALER